MNNKKQKFIVPKIPYYIKILDKILYPLMYILWYGKKDSLQETHGWHVTNFPIDWIDRDLCLPVSWDSESWIKKPYKWLHHIPILWWWENYIILQADKKSKKWFIGRESGNSAQIHILPIYDRNIKMLKWPRWTATSFFALDDQWNQIPIRKIDQWKLWDMKYPNIRLF